MTHARQGCCVSFYNPHNAGTEGRRRTATSPQVSRMKGARLAVPSSDLFDSPLITITLCALPYTPAVKR